jgi:hypothetical protein
VTAGDWLNLYLVIMRLALIGAAIWLIVTVATS